MDVYFIRHGQTAANAKRVYQAPTESLSPAGKSGVAAVIPEIRTLQPTHLYTSYFPRADETAQYIGYDTDLPVERQPHFHELYRPEDLYGKPHVSWASAKYIFSWFFGSITPLTDSRAETRVKFQERIISARTFLETHPHEARIVVVSHSIFIHFFAAHMCNDEPMSLWKAFPKLVKILFSKNTSITHLVYDHNAAPNTCPWQLQKKSVRSGAEK